MRERVCLNQDWLYLPQDRSAAKQRACDERKFEPICLPHTNVELPWHNFHDKEHQFISWYRRHLPAPKRWIGKRLLLTFDGVMIAAKVWVNGQYLGEHKGGYTPFSFDITDAVEFGKDNVIAVQVDSRERKDIPPFGHVVDYLTFGGIYRDVYIEVLEPVCIGDVFARPSKRSLDMTVTLVSAQRVARETEVTVRVAGRVARQDVILAPGEQQTIELTLKNLPVKPWSLDDPRLYDLCVSLDNGDSVTKRIGFREAHFAKDGSFYLNGKAIKLMGLDRHQTYAYVGGAMPSRLQRRDADILKYELGLNIVRTSHYPQSPHFLNRCDEIGLLVLEEIPGWQHIGDAAWKEVSKQELREMIVRDRHHPSIVLWGVRINESADDHDYYSETNRIAHELDPTRQTGGIRCHRDSEFLEDVFTYNDFEQYVQAPNNCPYLITEFCGHTYPAKPFDQEERLLEHALRHARKQNQQMGMAGVAGCIGWCAFDYNTHATFGSGDRICYHGVMDIFRFPKFAAYFYKSQQDPRETVVLEPASLMKSGERSGGGFHDLVVFSNCDTVDVYVGAEHRGTYEPDLVNFPHLPHPPFVCKGPNQWPWTRDFELVGKVKGRVAARKKVAHDGVPHTLQLFADDKTLNADGSDCTRIGFCVTDKYGNILPYATGAVELSLKGPGRLIGENPFALVAGRGAVYLRAGRNKGTVTITAKLARLGEKRVKVRMV